MHKNITPNLCFLIALWNSPNQGSRGVSEANSPTTSSKQFSETHSPTQIPKMHMPTYFSNAHQSNRQGLPPHGNHQNQFQRNIANRSLTTHAPKHMSNRNVRIGFHVKCQIWQLEKRSEANFPSFPLNKFSKHSSHSKST